MRSFLLDINEGLSPYLPLAFLLVFFNQNIFPRERVSEFMPVGVLLPVKNWYS